jgi:peroxiredoxin family protein
MHAIKIPENSGTEDLNSWFDRRFEEKMAEREAAHIPSMTIIATKGTLDMAYPPFILASTAAALGWEVSIFFTFYGLSLLKRELDLKVTPLGNPAMPMKLPMGPNWLQKAELKVPTGVMAATPGFQALVSALMKKGMHDKGIASVDELRELCLEADVQMIGCQMTAELFDWDRTEFIEEISDWVGATSFLGIAQKADVNLFV